jgi:hypothetical protein
LSRLSVLVLLLLVAVAAPCSRNEREEDTTFDQQLPDLTTTTDLPTTTTRSPTTRPTDDDEGPPVVLRGDGLGAEAFGAPVDEVIVALTLRWAPPDSDTGWVGAQDPSFPFPGCPGSQVRAVEWRGFWVLFSDGPTPHGPSGRRHFFTWYYLAPDRRAPGADPGGNRPALRTPEGISVAATVADLRRAYGERLELFDEAPEGPSFGVQTRQGGLFGQLTALDDGGRAWSLVGGGGCGS